MTIGLVIVSHSEKIAEGVVDLAGQMAGGVRIVAAGGTDESGIGTSFEKISAAIVEADGDGEGVVILCDLGSAILTAETALDFLDEELQSRVRIADAPLVEGSVAAAVAAEVGSDLEAVVDAATTANGNADADTAPSPEPLSAESGTPGDGDPVVITRSATLINASGLHARPASEFVRAASRFDAAVTVNGVEGKSLLRIMSLGLAQGTTVTVQASGPQASDAVDSLIALIESGFGE